MFAQEQPGPPPAPAPGPSFDFGALANGIVNGILGGLGDRLTIWVEQEREAILAWLRDAANHLWNGLWSSGANMLATPFDLTIDFPPARVLGQNLFVVVYGIAVLSIALLALRSIWGTLSGRGSILTDAVDGVLFGFLLASTSTLILSQAYVLCGLGSDAIGRLSYQPTFDPPSLLTFGPNLLIGAFIFAVMMAYGWRLWLRTAYRLILLMFLTPFAPVAGILWAIPQVRWISVLYWVTVGGWLAGGFLAIGAVSLAVQIGVLNSSNGLVSLIFGVALIQLAHDLMAILPRGALGGISVGSPFPGMMGGGAAAAAAGAAAGAVVGGAVGSSVVGAGGGGGGMALATIGGGSGELAGYGY